MARANRVQIPGTDIVKIADRLGLTKSAKAGETKLFRPGSSKVCVAVPNTKMVTRVYLVNWTHNKDTMPYEGKAPAKTVEQEIDWSGSADDVIQRIYRVMAEGLLGAKLDASPVASPAPVRKSKEELIKEFEAAYAAQNEEAVEVVELSQAAC